MKNNRHSYVPGILLIAAGIWLLSHQSWFMYDIWQFLVPVLLVLLAVAVYVSGRGSGKSSPVFWGAFLGLTGLFYFLRNYDILFFPSYSEWPIMIFIAGLSFLSLFAHRPKRVGLLLPGCLLTVWGGVNVLDAFDIRTFDYISLLEQYWPGLLMLLGVALILESFFSDPSQKK